MQVRDTCVPLNPHGKAPWLKSLHMGTCFLLPDRLHLQGSCLFLFTSFIVNEASKSTSILHGSIISLKALDNDF